MGYNSPMSTVTELQTELTKYTTARNNILSAGQSVSGAGGRSFTMGDLKWIDIKIKELEFRISVAQNSGKIPGYRPIFGGHLG